MQEITKRTHKRENPFTFDPEGGGPAFALEDTNLLLVTLLSAP